MATAGRFLENLVAHIQSNLAPRGVKVTSPERFYKDGKQVGEIDITLRGYQGSKPLFVGVECRDRPQDGPQGIPWIREIFGKQHQFDVDHMIAVSRTGFVPEAIELAKKFKIDTLVIRDVTDDSIEHFMRLARFAICVQRHKVVSFTCRVRGGLDRVLLDNLANAYVTISDLGGIRFLDDRVSLHDFLLVSSMEALEHMDAALENPTSFNGEEATITREAPLIVHVGDMSMDVHNLSINLKLWREVKSGEVLLVACAETGSPDALAYVGVCRAEFDGRRLNVFVSVANENIDGKGTMLLNSQIVDDAGKPFFPDRTLMNSRLTAIDGPGRSYSWGRIGAAFPDTEVWSDIDISAPRVSFVMDLSQRWNGSQS